MEMCMEFLLPENMENNFIEFVSHIGAALLPAASPVSKPQFMAKFYKMGENIFWKKAYIAKLHDIDKIDMEYVDSCNHYIIADTYKAPVIEVRRSGNSMDNIVLWASLNYDNGYDMVYKGEEFEKLYKTLETWIKLNCEVFEHIITLKNS